MGAASVVELPAEVLELASPSFSAPDAGSRGEPDRLRSGLAQEGAARQGRRGEKQAKRVNEIDAIVDAVTTATPCEVGPPAHHFKNLQNLQEKCVSGLTNTDIQVMKPTRLR